METIFEKITNLGIVPVVKIMNAVDLGKALVNSMRFQKSLQKRLRIYLGLILSM